MEELLAAGRATAPWRRRCGRCLFPTTAALSCERPFPQLADIIDRSLELYKRAYPRAKYNDSKHVWTFPSGAKIYFGAMQYTKDRTNYQGKRYDFIDFDELTQFLWDEYSYMFSRNRPNGPGTRCYMRAQANPGGVGHGWVKERFITAAKPMETIWEQVKIRYPGRPRGNAVEVPYLCPLFCVRQQDPPGE